jgi:hypothetical protein
MGVTTYSVLVPKIGPHMLLLPGQSFKQELSKSCGHRGAMLLSRVKIRLMLGRLHVAELVLFLRFEPILQVLQLSNMQSVNLVEQ